MTLLALTTGDTLLTSGASNRLSSALTSASVSCVLPPERRANGPPSVGAELTISTLEPSASICFSTASEEPVPTEISTITDPTPIISPRMVRPDRSLFAARPPNATRMVSVTHPPLD